LKTILTAVSAFDIHYPETDFPTWKAIVDFCKRNRVGLFVFGGDNLHCESISRHTKGKAKFKTLGQMKRELDGFRKHILEPIERVLPANCEKVWLTGNHEDWLEQMYEEQPELSGLIDFAEYLELTQRGWTVKPQGGSFKKGHLKYIHGDVLSGNHTEKALNTYVENIVYGHFHTAASGTKILPHTKKHKWQAWAQGCVGRLDSSYLKNRATGWLNQFGITEFRRGGFFNHYPVTLFGGRFSYGGKLYGAK
jgi:hypothetical protein